MISLSPPTILQQCHSKITLNCVNSSPGRVRKAGERRIRAEVLRRYPLKPGETVERPQRGEVVSGLRASPLDPGEYHSARRCVIDGAQRRLLVRGLRKAGV